MANGIALAEDKLRDRLTKLRKLFLPIASSRHVEAFKEVASSEIVLGVGRGGRFVREKRHPSIVRGVYFNYFEVWRRQDKAVVYDLMNVQLQLYRQLEVGKLEDVEELAIHSQPAFDAIGDSSKYKKGPHIHVDTRRGFFDKAHFPLFLGNDHITCKDCDQFDKAMKLAVDLIKSELIFKLS